MYASNSPFDKEAPRTLKHQRVDASAAVSFKFDGSRTRLDRLYQQGSAKVRFPKVHHGPLEAVVINTAGGLTGGDRLDWNLKLKEGSQAVVTTQACEKAYRSNSGPAYLTSSIKLSGLSSLHWLPQETILYDASSLERQFNVELDQASEFLALESIVLGREAMGETLHATAFHDRWRIRRAGKLIFSDDVRVVDNADTLAGLNENRAVASLFYTAPKDDETLSVIAENVRKVCPIALAAFSAFEGKLTGRIVANDSYELRQALIPVLRCLRGVDLPRVWRI